MKITTESCPRCGGLYVVTKLRIGLCHRCIWEKNASAADCCAMEWLRQSEPASNFAESLLHQAAAWFNEVNPLRHCPLSPKQFVCLVKMHAEELERLKKLERPRLRLSKVQQDVLFALASVGVELAPMELLKLIQKPEAKDLQKVRRTAERALAYLGLSWGFECPGELRGGPEAGRKC